MELLFQQEFTRGVKLIANSILYEEKGMEISVTQHLLRFSQYVVPQGVGGGEGARAFLRPFWEEKVYPAAQREKADDPNLKIIRAYQYVK